MSKVLVIGYNPPSFTRDTKIEAAHYRTGQFLLPLLDDGHEVCFCATRSEGDHSNANVPATWGERLHYAPMSFVQSGWARELQQTHDGFQPDCVVAVNFDCCLCATKLHTGKPIWMDIYGDIITIIQGSCYRARSDRGLVTTIDFMAQVLEKGDIFSVCSTPQKHMLVGELAMTGRLNWRSFGYEFAQVILPGAQAIDAADVLPRQPLLLAHEGIGSNDFVVLWCGGYNTWTNVDTLFKALEGAMAADARIHFVSVGASTYTAADNVYAQLLGKIEQSRYRERFHMLGWRPYREISEYYQASHVGLNIDGWHYETVYGTRTRLLEMLAAGLPVITTLGCELSYMLKQAGAALTFDIGNWHALTEHILGLANNPARRDALACTGQRYVGTDLSFHTTTESFRQWVQHPHSAPDRVHIDFAERMKGLEHRGRATVRQTVWRLLGARK